ncbi:MAG: hypothetical protein K8I27_06930 [Planctomycetes bacterium]|nr:hypothetical protein [Planctomycetota bacterium]
MAKKPLPAKRPPAAGSPPPKKGSAPTPQQSEAVGKFDKFSAFALAIPSALLAIITMVIAIGYTHDVHDVGLFGFPKKSINDWNAGSSSIQKLGVPIQITGFESHNYIGRLSEGEVDVAVLNVGYEHNVNLGDVFTLSSPADATVRLEFVVFDVGPNISRAYILLGQDVSGGDRKYSLTASSVETLCKGKSNIDVKRDWGDQIIRRYAEARSNAQ